MSVAAVQLKFMSFKQFELYIQVQSFKGVRYDTNRHDAKR